MNNQPQAPRKAPLIQQYLTKHKDQIAAALPKHINADRMARIALTEVRKTPALLYANPQSLFGAIIQCSQLGLEPGNALGHAYLLPFKNRKENRTDVQLIIGYKGMLTLARNSGQIISITARAVFAQDEFRYSFGLDDDLHHVPYEGKDKGPLTHVYAVAKLVGGGIQWDVMTRDSVEEIREQSKAGNSGPWMTHYEEMAKKTVIRRLFKYLPVSVELQRAAGMDEMADAGVSQQNDSIIEGEWEPGPLAEEQAPAPQSKTDSVKQRLRGNGQQAQAEQREPEQDTVPAAEPTTVPTEEEALAAQLVDDIKGTDDPDEVRAMLEQAEVELTGTHKAKVTRAGNARLEQIGGNAGNDNPLE